jgi:hypothetical protein
MRRSVRSRTPRLDAHAQTKALAEVGDLAPVLEPRRRELLLGLAHAPQRALDPGPLLLDERLHLAQRESPRDHHLHTPGVDQDARVAGALGTADAVGNGGHVRARI